MAEDVQKGIFSDSTLIIKLLMIFTMRKINFQHILFLTSFIAFGIGDGVSAALMMNARGAGIEAHPFARFLFLNLGFDGLIIAKMWFTFIILYAVYIVQIRSPTSVYWTVNGFLTALTAGGLLAVNANLDALSGQVTAAPSAIIFIYLSLVLILMEIGSLMDERSIIYVDRSEESLN